MFGGKNIVTNIEEQWHNRAILFLLVILCWRVIYPAISPLNLSPDEAYYWDWSRRLDWGYYSKPPMVAWIDWLSTTLFGATTWAIRLPAALLATLGLWFVYLTASRLYDNRTGFWAMLATFASPGAAVMSFAMTIDAPMLFAWSASIFFLTQALWSNNNKKTIIFWLLTGFVVGLGLLSKQTMVAFWMLGFFFFVISKQHRKWLFSPFPYLAAAITCLMFIPTLLWNSQHDWITFQHTAHHFEPSKSKFFLDIKSFFEFIASQIGILSPVTGILSMVVSLGCLFAWQRLSEKERLLLCFSGLPLVGIAILSLRQGINANWPAPFHVTGIILLAAMSNYSKSFNAPLQQKITSTFQKGVFFGLALVICLYVSPWIIMASGMKTELVSRTMGWRELGAEVSGIIKEQGNKDIMLMSNRRQIVSELAFYVEGQPITYRWSESEKGVKTQYEIWGAPPKDNDVLFVTYSNETLPKGVETLYNSIKILQEIPAKHGKAFKVYLLQR